MERKENAKNHNFAMVIPSNAVIQETSTQYKTGHKLHCGFKAKEVWISCSLVQWTTRLPSGVPSHKHTHIPKKKNIEEE